MRLIKWLAIAIGAYLAIVVAFECLVGFMGRRQAEAGVQPGEAWIAITTSDGARSQDTVVAVAQPDVLVTRGGERKPFRFLTAFPPRAYLRLDPR